MLLHTSSLHTNTASLLRTDPEAPVYNCCSVRVVWAYCCVIMHIASWCVLKQVVFTCTFISCKGGQVCIQVIIIQDCYRTASHSTLLYEHLFFYFFSETLFLTCVWALPDVIPVGRHRTTPRSAKPNRWSDPVVTPLSQKQLFTVRASSVCLFYSVVTFEKYINRQK